MQSLLYIDAPKDNQSLGSVVAMLCCTKHGHKLFPPLYLVVIPNILLLANLGNHQDWHMHGWDTAVKVGIPRKGSHLIRDYITPQVERK